jgi:hypothetical protein
MYFNEKFGLFHVDFNGPERKRSAKKSAEFYSHTIKSNKIPTEFLSVEISQWPSDTVGNTEFNTLFCPDSCEWIAELMVMVTFVYQAVIPCFIQKLFWFVGVNLARR